MKNKYTTAKFTMIMTANIKAFFVLSLLILGGCLGNGKYNVLLAANANSYRSTMNWDEIRESSSGTPYSVSAFDAEGNAIPFYRFNHDDGSIMPETPENRFEIHISTPIIIKKTHNTFSLTVLDHGTKIVDIPVVIKELKLVQDDQLVYPTVYYVLPVPCK